MGGTKRQLNEIEPQWHRCAYFGCGKRGTEGQMKSLGYGYVEEWYCPPCLAKYGDECMADLNDGEIGDDRPMAGTLGEEARKLLLQIQMNQEADAVDVTTDTAKELFRFGYLTIREEPLDPEAARRRLRWVIVTEPGRALLTRFYSTAAEQR